MNNLLSLPMYDVNRPDTQALWSALMPLLVAEGLAAERLNIVWPEDNLPAHWQDENLLLSQTCGYPLAKLLPRVQLVGNFHYSAPGCERNLYRSFLVARQKDGEKKLEDFRGRRAACNSRDSQSGYNILRSMIAPLAREGRFFAQAVITGSHRQSMLAVAQQSADLASIDCITWALLARHEPHLLSGLAVIGQTPSAPGLPLITSRQTSPETLACLRRALTRLAYVRAYRTQREALLITGFSEVNRRDYQVILQLEQQAREQNVMML
jgi:ABC-type phosphate/phosphonate transport system substrate-binding protein